MGPAITVTATSGEPLVCGVVHTADPVRYRKGRWSEEEIAHFVADDRLEVEIHEDEPDTGLIPQAGSIQGVLDATLVALRLATPDEVLGFLEAMETDDEIREKIAEAIRGRDAGKDAGEEDPARDRHARIVEAIGKLDLEAGVNATKDGRPTVDALEAILGIDITAAERDAAWETLQP